LNDVILLSQKGAPAKFHMLQLLLLLMTSSSAAATSKRLRA
jgi:hypothetical protein